MAVPTGRTPGRWRAASPATHSRPEAEQATPGTERAHPQRGAVVLGFDRAWTDRPKRPGALCAIAFDRDGRASVRGPCRVGRRGPRERIACGRRDHALGLEAIDQPTAVPTATGSRPPDKSAAVLRGALATDPWGLLASAVGNTLRLLLVVRLEEELKGSIPKRALDALDELAPGSGAAYRASAVARGAWPFALLDRWLALTSLAAAAFLVFWAVAGPGRSGGDEAARQRALLVLVVAALLANAALCGVASGPFPRYQMRILWLLPGAALLLLLARGGAGPAPGRDPPIRP